MGEWLNMLWYIHTMKYFSAIRMNYQYMQQFGWISRDYAK